MSGGRPKYADPARRLTPPRRRNLATQLRSPLTTDREYTAEELAFSRAVECYRRTRRRPFPTCAELLAIAVSLGYRRVAEAGPLPEFRSNGARRKKKGR